MIFTDSHAHLPSVAERLGREVLDSLLADYSAAWEAGRPGATPAAGSATVPVRPLLVDIGTEAADFPDRLGLLGRWPFLRYSLGLWPGREALADPEAFMAALKASLDGAGGDAAAIGECGLDYWHMEGSREAQLSLFRAQAGLAAERGLPLIVHSREAFEDSAAVVAEAGGKVPVVIHCFGYGPAEAEAFLALGCHISFAGNLSYRKAEALREAIVRVPEDRLLLETDSPYMNPEPKRGKPCSPRDIERTYALAARLRGTFPEALHAAVSANAFRLFG
jgi:TatD DNase family protein